MKRRIVILVLVALVLAFVVPVSFEIVCQYKGDSGDCTDQGRSILGTPIPAPVLQLFAFGTPLVLLVYIGVRIDRRFRNRNEL